MLKGSLVALVTPMDEEGGLDLASSRALIDFHVAQNTNGIVVIGTTGESPTVDFDEHHLLMRTAVDHSAGRIPVIAGTGANSTREAIDLSIFAKESGVDACISVAPYYNKPTQEGLYQHFKAIAEAVDLPHILYNVPGRTVADIANALRIFQISLASRMRPVILNGGQICCVVCHRISPYIAEMTRVHWQSYCWVGMVLFR